MPASCDFLQDGARNPLRMGRRSNKVVLLSRQCERAALGSSEMTAIVILCLRTEKIFTHTNSREYAPLRGACI